MYLNSEIYEMTDIYNDLKCKYMVIKSKIDANSIHGMKYGIKEFRINEIDLEKNLLCIDLNKLRDNILTLQSNVNLLSAILEHQRMQLMVSSYCSSGQVKAFPKYIITLLKKKYPKLYFDLQNCYKNIKKEEDPIYNSESFDEFGFDMYTIGDVKLNNRRVRFNI